MKLLLFLLLFSSTAMQSYSQQWRKLTRLINKEQAAQITSLNSDYNKSEFYNAYKKNRKKILELLNINFSKDTIYILERYGDGQDSYIWSTLWNRKMVVSYSGDYLNQTVSVEKNHINFPAYMMRLCSLWKLDIIMKEAESHFFLPITYDCLTRIILNNKKYKIDCIWFREFFLLERDQKCDALYELGQYNIWE